MWIRTEADLRRLITDYRCLARYLDMSFGNMSYASTFNKPGEKKLRTRMRVGFEVDVSPEAIRQCCMVSCNTKVVVLAATNWFFNLATWKKLAPYVFILRKLTLKQLRKS